MHYFADGKPLCGRPVALKEPFKPGMGANAKRERSNTAPKCRECDREHEKRWCGGKGFPIGLSAS